jgi:excisionase family DNA binding protein
MARHSEAREGPERLLTVPEVAHVFSVTAATVRRMIWAGQLPHVRIARTVRVCATDVIALIERGRHPRAPEARP